MNLRPIHYDAIRLLAKDLGNYESIALKLGLTSRTLQRWRRDPDFKAALQRKMDEPKEAQEVTRRIYGLLGGLLARLETEGSAAPTAETLALFARLARDFRLLDLGKPDPEAERVARLEAVQRAMHRNRPRNDDDGPADTADDWDPNYLRDPRAWNRRERANARAMWERTRTP